MRNVGPPAIAWRARRIRSANRTERRKSLAGVSKIGERGLLLVRFQLLPSLRQGAQSQRVQSNESLRVAVVVGAVALLEGDEVAIVERIRRRAPDDCDMAPIELELDRSGHELLRRVDRRLQHL